MTIEENLNQRLHKNDIDRLCRELDSDHGKSQLLALALNGNECVAMNALWVFTHFNTHNRAWLEPHRGELINRLLNSSNESHKRLILNLLERMTWTPSNIDSSLLDYCFSQINSNAPYAIRAFCLKLAYRQCRHYPALLSELILIIELMQQNDLPPGIRSARRNVLAQIARTNKTAPKNVKICQTL